MAVSESWKLRCPRLLTEVSTVPLRIACNLNELSDVSTVTLLSQSLCLLIRLPLLHLPVYERENPLRGTLCVCA